MRNLLFALFFAFTATSASAQTLARVQVMAHLRIPDFLTLRVGEATTTGDNARRVTVYVSANRIWQLSVAKTCGSTCGSLRWRILTGMERSSSSGIVGRNGNDIPVTIEYEWDASSPPPESALRYELTPA